MNINFVIPEWIKTLIISALSSFFTVYIHKLFSDYEKSKSLKVYVKFVGSKCNQKMCCYEDNSVLFVPLWIEFVNSYNEPLICRDFNLFLYSKGKEIDRFHQINEFENSNGKLQLANNGMYSFVVSPNSIYRLEGEFATKKSISNEHFDSIYISYVDGKNKVKKYKLLDINKPWTPSELKYKTNCWYDVNK